MSQSPSEATCSFIASRTKYKNLVINPSHMATSIKSNIITIIMMRMQCMNDRNRCNEQNRTAPSTRPTASWHLLCDVEKKMMKKKTIRFDVLHSKLFLLAIKRRLPAFHYDKLINTVELFVYFASWMLCCCGLHTRYDTSARD